MKNSAVFAMAIDEKIEGKLDLTDIQRLIEQPKFEGQGDLAFPCFALAKTMRKAPSKIAEELAPLISHPSFEKVQADGAYINAFFQKKAASKAVIEEIMAKGSTYGQHEFGNGKNIVIDFSSPNIAKPFSMGHLRSTVIGNSLAKIAEKCGYQTVKINHLGDWGTQFGKLIVAYKQWGEESAVQKEPIKELLELYVRFHQEAEKNPKLNEEARSWFKKLEDGDQEASRLWLWFKEESLQEFNKIYQLLGMSFDSLDGEAFYNDKMQKTIALLAEKNLLSASAGAEVVDLTEEGMPPLLIRKSDGATLYATRDLTAALYRHENYQFAKAWYVVGQEQTLHFKQVFQALQKMGFSFANEMEHIPFGFILKNGKKMSTRKGGLVLLEKVLQEAIGLAAKNIEEKNPALEEKQQVAEMVGVGAVVFHDLRNDRMTNVEFSLQDMLRFEGATGPYVQYTHARACSILRKAGGHHGPIAGLDDAYSWQVVKRLLEFPDAIEKSFHHNEPSAIAKFLIELAQDFNKYYSHVKILQEDEELGTRLALVSSTAIVLKEGLKLLGIGAPEQM